MIAVTIPYTVSYIPGVALWDRPSWKITSKALAFDLHVVRGLEVFIFYFFYFLFYLHFYLSHFIFIFYFFIFIYSFHSCVLHLRCL